MAKQARRVTSADVARASGVSRATVSYVLNNDPRQSIPADTRERVLAAARALGYQPSPAARMLRIGYSQLVLAVLPFEQVDPAVARDLKALEARLSSHGYSLICYFGRGESGESQLAAHITPAVVLSYAAATEPADEAFLQQFKAPIITVENPTFREPVGRAQIAYLHQRGWQRVIFATDERPDVQRLAQARLAGVRQGCAERKLALPEVLAVPRSRAEAGTAIQHLLVQPGPPPGFCCYNDEVAFAVLAALVDLGVAVPQSAAVIGCDDIPLAQFSNPALTTIGFDQRPSQDYLVQHILATIAGEPSGPAAATRLTVIERQSA